MNLRTSLTTRSRRGFIQFLALFVLMVLGILILQFRSSSSHARFSAYQTEQGEIVRQLCESALDEAFRRLAIDVQNPDSEAARKLLERRTTPWTIATPLANALAQTTVRTYWTPEISVQATLVDFRQSDEKGQIFFQTTTGSEGLGTLQLEAKARLTPNGGPTKYAPVCTLFRHHDFKVVHMGYLDGETGYQQTYPLKYALLVRHGLAEFRRSGGTSLNPPAGISLTVKQRDLADAVLGEGRRGKIFFGGTAGNDAPLPGSSETPGGNYVFLNLALEDRVFLPSIPQDKVFSGPLGLADIKSGGCILAFHLIQLFPPWFDIIPRKMPLAFGTFWCEMVPFVDFDPSNDSLFEQKDAKQQAITTLFQSALGAEKNTNRGVQLIELESGQADNPDFIRSVLEGDIRQRFLYFVALCVHLGLNGAESLIPAMIALNNQLPIMNPCILLPPFDVTPVVMGWEDQQEQAQALSLISTLSAELPLLSGVEFPPSKTSRQLLCTSAFPRPVFYAPDQTEQPITSPDALPFQNTSLCGVTVATMKELAAAGLYDPTTGTLTINGLVQLTDEPLTLGEGNVPTRVTGRGGIIAHKGIRILAGLQKTSAEDALMLFTSEGNISIETPDLIQAALIAMNRSDSGKLSLQHPLNLHGLLAVDLLDTGKWIGANVIRYDPVFLDLAGTFAISLNRQVTLHRTIMAEL